MGQADQCRIDALCFIVESDDVKFHLLSGSPVVDRGVAVLVACVRMGASSMAQPPF